MTENQGAFLSVEEVAARLSVAPVTVRRLFTSGDLTAHRIGRVWRIDPAELDAFLSRNRSGEQSAGSVKARQDGDGTAKRQTENAKPKAHGKGRSRPRRSAAE